MDVQYCLPPVLKIADDTEFGFHRPGVVQSKTFVGNVQARTYSPRGLRTSKIVLTDFNDDGEALLAWQGFLDQTNDLQARVWIKSPFLTYVRKHPCGPLGDASNKVFPVPLFGYTSLDVFVNNALKTLTTDYLVDGQANRMVDNAASAEDPDLDLVSVSGTCTKARTYGLSLFGAASWKVTPTGSVADVGLIDSNMITGVVVGRSYFGGAFVYGPGTFRSDILWYTDADAYISTTSGTPVAVADGSWTAVFAEGTAPATAAKAKVKTIRTTTSSNILFIDCRGLIPFSYANWHLPSFSPTLVEMVSAPALNAVVEAMGSGYPLVPGKAMIPASSWRMYAEGIALPSSFEFYEELDR